MRRSDLVVLQGGVSVYAGVLQRLLDLEARGCRFDLLDDGRFRVTPPEILTDDDRRFLREWRDEARRVIDYCENPPHVM